MAQIVQEQWEQLEKEAKQKALEQQQQQQQNQQQHPSGLRKRQRRRRRLAPAARPLAAWGSAFSNNTQVAQFLGCGWSFHFTLDFPCLSGDLDDSVYIANNGTFIVEGDPTNTKGTIPEPLLLCDSSHESFNRAIPEGRWVRERRPSNVTCPSPHAVSTVWNSMIPVTKFIPDKPHCWNREDLTPLNKKCKETNCAMIEQNSHWLSSKLQHEERWMGVWKHYRCNYMEFTNEQLSQCFQTQKIASIQTAGASIGAMLKEYIGARLEENVEYYSGEDGRTVTVDTLKWPHQIWHLTEANIEAELNKMPDQNEDALHFWVSPYFISSEREPYVHLERGLKFLEFAEAILKPKGYRMINAFDPSAAFTVCFLKTII